MKKVLTFTLALVIALGLLAGCAPANEPSAPADTGAPGADAELKKITVGATPEPHAGILSFIKDQLAADGYELVIKEFTDYPQLNPALVDKTIDANYFQHITYLNDFNSTNGADLVSGADVHYEPMGLYPGKTKTIDALADGAVIAVPNDTTNEARALMLLEANGLIKLKEGSGLNATPIDIVDNPKNLKIEELDAAQLPRMLSDMDMAVINGNYALQAGLNAQTDAIAKEEKDSEAAKAYVNVLAIRNGDESRPEIQALVKALTSEATRKFMDETYKGAVVPMF